jgi:phosphate transport system substrate-binding protein
MLHPVHSLRFTRPGIGLASFALVFALLTPQAWAETLKVGGTGAALGTMRLLGAAFSRQQPEIRIEVLPYIGSTGAIRGIARGTIDLGLSGRPASPDEEKLEATLRKYALTPLIIAAHLEVPLNAVSRDQLAAIYSGQPSRWEGGGMIRLVLRPAQETDSLVLRTISPAVSQGLDVALAKPGMRRAATDQDAADMLEQTPGAIGTSTLALALSEQRRFKVLALDGVMPDVEALRSGRYPYNKPLYLVTRPQPSKAVQAFVDFIATPAGQAILIKNGQLPVRP